MRVIKQSVELEWATPDMLAVIEVAGRTCYKSESSGNPVDFVRMLIARGHESVLEHGVASFRIVCDRGVSHELVRHRLASYSQESTRYCNYGKSRFGREVQVIEPPDLNAEAAEAWKVSVGESERAYFRMLDSGCAPQIARSVLPTCLKTEIVMTCNLREWRHFLKLRMAKAAHPQMREVAEMVKAKLAEVVGAEVL